MKRALVFLLLGPASVVLTIWVAFGMPNDAFAVNVAVLLFICTSLVSGIVGLLDGFLTRAFPIVLRAALTAAVGAIAAAGLPVALLGRMPQDLSMLFGIGGAFYMGACSLLSNDYRKQTA